MFRRQSLVTGVATEAVFPSPRCVGPIGIGFEGLPHSTILTTQMPGLTFPNIFVLIAGISLNESEFPPRPGSNVTADDGGPIYEGGQSCHSE